MSQIRQPKFEILRIAAILLISMMHGIRSAYASPNILCASTFVAINAIGNMGVTLFILISGYFGIKFHFSKIIKLWLIVLTYSIVLFLFDLSKTGFNLEINKDFIKQLYIVLTPISSNTWWFITSYTILFMLSPLLNIACERMTKKHFTYLLCVLLLFYSVCPTLLMHSLSNTPNGKCTENMILAYLIGRYISIYHIPQTVVRHSFQIFILCVLIIYSINFYIFDPLFLAKDHNLFIIIGAFSLFLWVMNTEFTLRERTSHIICSIASYTFPLYLLNWPLVSRYDYLYEPFANKNIYLCYFFLFQLTIISVSLCIEFIRRLILDKCIQRISNNLENLIKEYLI